MKLSIRVTVLSAILGVTPCIAALADDGRIQTGPGDSKDFGSNVGRERTVTHERVASHKTQSARVRTVRYNPEKVVAWLANRHTPGPWAPYAPGD